MLFAGAGMVVALERQTMDEKVAAELYDAARLVIPRVFTSWCVKVGIDIEDLISGSLEDALRYDARGRTSAYQPGKGTPDTYMLLLARARLRLWTQRSSTKSELLVDKLWDRPDHGCIDRVEDRNEHVAMAREVGSSRCRRTIRAGPSSKTSSEELDASSSGATAADSADWTPRRSRRT